MHNLIPLPTAPKEIPEALLSKLPFSLPISDLRQIRAIATSLRNIYTFDQLPKEYISDNRTSLPPYPSQLNEETS